MLIRKHYIINISSFEVKKYNFYKIKAQSKQIVNNTHELAKNYHTTYAH